jgi:hypothetical protein
MDILLTATRKKTAGPNLVINCPRCGQSGPASSYDLEEKLALFFVIPMGVFRSGWVVCGHCGGELLARTSAAELAGKSPEQLAALLATRQSPIVKALAILSVVVFLVPGLGLLLGIIATACTFKTRGWARMASFAGLALSVLASIVYAVVLLA